MLTCRNLCLFLLLLTPSFLSAQLPDDFIDEKLPVPFDFPLGIAFDEDGRGFVWEKAGKVFVIDTTGEKVSEPLIDISEEVSNWKDHGLMGFALDRDFLQNGRFYLYYALDLHHHYHFGTPAYHPDTTTTWEATIGRVARYEADPASGFTRLVPGSRKVLLGESLADGIPLTFQFHGLGSIVAGNDGTLLLTCGDGISSKGADTGGDSLGTYASDAIQKGIMTPDQDLGSYRSQYLGSLNGKLMRIDPDNGDGLPSNPFYEPENPRSPASRIWSTGLRNAYRIMVRPESGSHYAADGDPGHVFVGDVGTGGWEELNIVKKGGGNYGWPIMEGPYWTGGFANVEPPQNPLAPNPLYDGGASCAREFFTFRELMEWPRSPGQELPPVNPCNFSLQIPLSPHRSLAVPPDLSWSNSRWNLPIRTVVPGFSVNDNLTGIALSDPASGVEGEEFGGFSSLAGVFYTGSSFPTDYRGKYFGFDHEGWIRVFEFDEESRLISIQPFYDEATNIIHLTLNPRDGSLYLVNMQNEVRRISYGGTPLPVAVIEADRYFGTGDLLVEFDGTNSTAAQTGIREYFWDFGDGDTSTLAKPTHLFLAAGDQPRSYVVSLSVTDSVGTTARAERLVSLNNSPPKVRISSFEDGDRYPLDKTVILELSGEVSDSEHGQEELEYEWQVFLHHNDHFHPEPVSASPLSYALLSPLGCDRDEYWYRVTLAVTDPEGLQSSDSKLVFPACEEPAPMGTDIIAEGFADRIELAWSDDVNEEVAEYEIQRTTDFFHFETLGYVSAGNGVDYGFVDSFPKLGINIYRIKIIDSRRGFSYSNLGSANFPLRPEIRVFPNPASGQITIALDKPEAKALQVELFTPNAVKVLSRTFEIEDIRQSFAEQLPLQYLDNGLYYFRITNGQKEQSGPLLIAK